MAQIRFQLLHNADGTAAVDNLNGSGLAFYGSAAGSSVQIGEYQGMSRIASADGSAYKDETNNIKYVTSTFPSGQCVISGQYGSAQAVGLSGVKTFQGTLGVEFGHTSAVKVQNAQLRIYDRANINNPASGVNTKAAEIINHNGGTYATQGTLGSTSEVVGSGDILWWGEPWPAEMVTKNYYTSSTGIKYINGLDSATNTNGDSRLSAAGLTGSYDTVGGTGIVVPLSDSPGSGQKNLSLATSAMVWPKWTQYVNSTVNQALFFGNGQQNFGDGSAVSDIGKTFGGTGLDTHHTWSIALSASPLSIGSKEQYGVYVSLEYL